MKPDTLSLLNEPVLLQSKTRWITRLSDLFAGRPAKNVFVLQGIQAYTEEYDNQGREWLEGGLDQLAQKATHALDEDVFRPLILNYNPHGVHFVDYLFGADVFQMEDKSWQARTLATPIGKLEPPNLANSPGWQRMQDFTHAFLAQRAAGVTLALPTIASALNIALNLYGQEILAAMYEAPEAAAHDLQVINEVLCSLHRWYRNNVPEEQQQCIVPDGRFQPHGYGQLCGCSTQLLSPRLYREFVAPLDARLLSIYPHGGMIHLCGDHDQHIPAWRSMLELRSVQVNDRAAEDLALYFESLREDQILYVNPCQGMPVERILAITGGRRLVLVEDIRQPIRLLPDLYEAA